MFIAIQKISEAEILEVYDKICENTEEPNPLTINMYTENQVMWEGKKKALET